MKRDEHLLWDVSALRSFVISGWNYETLEFIISSLPACDIYRYKNISYLSFLSLLTLKHLPLHMMLERRYFAGCLYTYKMLMFILTSCF